MLESTACGTPIVTTNNGEKLDWIHNRTGIVVDYEKTQIKNALYKILTDDTLRKSFGEEGKRLVRETYNWDSIVEQITMLYRQLL